MHNTLRIMQEKKRATTNTIPLIDQKKLGNLPTASNRWNRKTGEEIENWNQYGEDTGISNCRKNPKGPTSEKTYSRRKTDQI